MSESGVEASEAEGEHAAKGTGQSEACQRCGRNQGLVGKYDVWLCRQCFREIARSMGFKKFK
ncbi:30S ribosomal protein S14 [Halobacteriales archaeon QS_8_65_32]|jgi:small subunit ribosomal protein S14|nr:MAG: 30S ribosomal protein S14 [Halobacteriales archaeon QS_8_65_32]